MHAPTVAFRPSRNPSFLVGPMYWGKNEGMNRVLDCSLGLHERPARRYASRTHDSEGGWVSLNKPTPHH